MRYNKLVRDKIIGIIEAKGGKALYHTATDEEYRKKLKEKLLEEVKEFLEAESIEEMADIFEVITALLELKDWKIEDVIALQKEKREKRGGFEKKLFWRSHRYEKDFDDTVFGNARWQNTFGDEEAWVWCGEVEWFWRED